MESKATFSLHLWLV